MKNSRPKELEKIIEEQSARLAKLEREIEIEAALERVRVASMAMHHTDELGQVVEVLFRQLSQLKLDFYQVWINIFFLEEGLSNCWFSPVDGVFSEPYTAIIPLGPFEESSIKSWRAGEEFSHLSWRGLEEVNKTSKSLTEMTGHSSFQRIQEVKQMDRMEIVDCNHKYGVVALAKNSDITDSDRSVLKRFTKVFEQTYTRFLDLQKAEAQAREAQIEAAMERIRSKALAMHSSDGLKDVIIELRRQIDALGELDLEASVIHFYSENETMFESIAAVRPPGEAGDIVLANVHFPVNAMKQIEYMIEMYHSDVSDYTLEFNKEMAEEWQQVMVRHAPMIAERRVGFVNNRRLSDHSEFWNFSDFSEGSLLLVTHSPASTDTKTVLSKAAAVFDIAYRRYRDLQKAEAQAREAQIEVALERVRARTMAMHKSSELAETASVLFQQLFSLGIKPGACAFSILNEQDQTGEIWISSDGNVYERSFIHPYHTDPPQERIFEAWRSGKTYHLDDLENEELTNHLQFLSKHMPIYDMLDSGNDVLPKRIVIHAVYFSQGFIGLTYDSPQLNHLPTFIRFAKVFEQTYTRFLDLQKAEAQAREAQIEAALERVRYQAMAMRKSEDLVDCTKVVFEELEKLDLTIQRSGIGIFDRESRNCDLWTMVINSEGEKELATGITSMTIHPMLVQTFDAWLEQKSVSYVFEGKDLVDYYQIISEGNFHLSDEVIHTSSSLPKEYYFYTPFVAGGLYFFADKEPLESDKIILTRFAEVFNMTYTRFLDLQKAETQAREARIEAALERVRSKTMAMHNSLEVGESVATLFEELSTLGLLDVNDRCGIGIMQPNEIMEAWTAAKNPEGKAELTIGHINMKLHPMMVSVYGGWLEKKEINQYILEGEDKHGYYDAIRNQSDYKIKRDYFSDQLRIVHTDFYFNEGCLYVFSQNEFSANSIAVFLRFVGVFGQTYRRYLDLQKAEAQAREAQIEAALEKIRSRSLAIHNSVELEDVIAVLFEKLKGLGLSFDAASIQMFKNGSKDSVSWVANPDVISKPLLIQHPYDEKLLHKSQLFFELWEARKTSKDILNKRYSFKEKNKYFEYVLKYNPELPAEVGKRMREASSYIHSLAVEKNAILIVDSWADSLISQEDFLVVKRFAKVFEQTYTRFLDLQKAEAQAREAQIEAALERVRARSMAMHKSDELADVVSLMYAQIQNLGFTDWGCAIVLCNEEAQILQYWYAELNMSHSPEFFTVPLTNKTIRKVWKLWKEGIPQFTIELLNKEKDEFTEHMLTETDHKNLPDEVKHGWRSVENVFFCYSNIKNGFLEFIDVVPFAEENLLVYQRFAKVFEQTYTRFLDLQKAEAQAKEAQIEAALERVRSRSMAMHSSNDLQKVITVVMEQFELLGFHIDMANFNFYGTKDWRMWLATPDYTYPDIIHIPYIKHPMFDGPSESIRKGGDFYSDTLTQEELHSAVRHMYANSSFGQLDSEERKRYIFTTDGFTRSIVFMKNIMLTISKFSSVPYTDEQNLILKRFAKVFEQAYIRFLDLQKAEAQAREAQIEAALERVRSRTMAMHYSDELPDAAKTMFERIVSLGFQPWVCTFTIFRKDSMLADNWASSRIGQMSKMVLPHDEDRSLNNIYNEWKKSSLFHVESLEGKELIDHFEYMRSIPAVSEFFEEIADSDITLPHSIHFNCAMFSYGYLCFGTLEPRPEYENIFKRFAIVFEQTYTRFLDLKKAEAQAREAQIEAALERVRSRTMAMHQSKELAEVVSLLYEQIQILGFTDWGSSIIICDEESQVMGYWYAEVNLSHLPDYCVVPLTNKIVKKTWDLWQSGIPQFDINLLGKEKEDYTSFMLNDTDYKHSLPEDVKEEWRKPRDIFFSYFAFKYGLLEFVDIKPIDKVNYPTYLRFAQVIEQTYTRFLDIQKAEAQAREAQIEAALEKVRSRSLAMQKTEELQEVVAVVAEKLKQLGVILDANGVIICTYFPNSKDVMHWMAAPDFSISSSYVLPYFDHPIFNTAWESKINGDEYFSKSFTKEEKDSFFQYAFAHSDYRKFPEEFKQWIFQNDKHSLSFAWAKNSALLLPSHTGILPSEDDKEILKRFARVFEQAYIRFMDLQKAEQLAKQAQIDLENLIAAKKKTEETLSELKATQAQLIQAEKMASLGELTAGIAHEIQNPLNFVNNFSDVNIELAEELEEEINKGDLEEARAIIKDMKSNEEKINHHGKRADAIVKGMLQHSRSSTGQKEPADINALCDEYLRLSYHGLRAKDSTFNADFSTEFDPDLPKVNVIPQDLGRVLLNLINNAFYAVSERSQKSKEDYQPLVKVSTKITSLFQGGLPAGQTGVKISVTDNGPGIPESIKEKIFQPFFTTKPTGQGTGLGLSLSYDIVKAHGGELSVVSESGNGTEFIIKLPHENKSQ